MNGRRRIPGLVQINDFMVAGVSRKLLEKYHMLEISKEANN